MSSENTMTKTDETSENVPVTQNGHGASNGAPREVDTTEGRSKKKKKKKRHQHDRSNAPAPHETAAQTTSTTSDAPQEGDVALTETPPTLPFETTTSAEVPTEALPEEPAEAPAEIPVESLRLRMKVWTDHATGKRYLMPSAFMRDVVNGQPISDVMYAYALRDGDTRRVTLTAGEWQALPFVYVQEDGPVPRLPRPDDSTP